MKKLPTGCHYQPHLTNKEMNRLNHYFKQAKAKKQRRQNEAIGILGGIAVLFWLLILLFSLFSCTTPAIELTYKAKCVAINGNTKTFEYLYNCHKKSPCAIQFDAVDSREYEIGKYYWVKYRR